MPIAAVPDYLQKNDPEFYLSAPPGHRFQLYFAMWGTDGETQRIDWRTKDKVKKFKRVRGELTFDGWTDIENGQFACTIAACRTPTYIEETPRARRPKSDAGLKPWKPMMEALLARQRQAFDVAATADATLRLDALATAPFTTGLGNDHPLENGFAFLNPYGLPYLPGSGVKGVLRQAARELASGDWGDAHGWSEDKRYTLMQGEGEKRRPVLDKNKQPVTFSMIDALFGFEAASGDTHHQRGALVFWDVMPQIKGDHLAVEIMTPHQSHYYQKSESPHESGSPNPINFLTVPPGSDFVFHVQCNRTFLERIAPALAANDYWKELLLAAFAHAFDWLGFGAKTAVGYGTMREPSNAERAAAKSAELRCEWVDTTIKEIETNDHIPPHRIDDVLRGKRLAEAWTAISDRAIKEKALADIRSRWQQKGWWDSPPPGVASKAKAIYERG